MTLILLSSKADENPSPEATTGKDRNGKCRRVVSANNDTAFPSGGSQEHPELSGCWAVAVQCLVISSLLAVVCSVV